MSFPDVLRGRSLRPALWGNRVRNFLLPFRHSRERLVSLIFGLLFFSGFGVMVYQRYLNETVAIPQAGGQYVEGVVGNRAQLTEIITQLTSAGLVSITSNQKVMPVLARNWAISLDGKTYTFELQDGVEGAEVAKAIQENELFKTITVQAVDPRTVVFRLKQPFGPFLSLLSLPLFPYGPYTIGEEEGNEIKFEANPTFPAGRAFLDRITIRVFPDESSLQQAVARKEVTGTVSSQPIRGWQHFEATLPRTIEVIFNIDRPALQEQETRSKILRGESLPEKVSLTIITTPQLKSFGDDLVGRWKGQNIEASLELIDDAKLKQDVLPKRDYDVLVYGVDEGVEPDPFRFWHSSQATETGLNLAQLKDQGLDGMLEAARLIVNDAERFGKYQEIEQKVNDLAVRIVLKRMTISFQVSSKIKGVEEPLMVNPASRYNLVWKWYTNERRVRKTEDGGQKTD